MMDDVVLVFVESVCVERTVAPIITNLFECTITNCHDPTKQMLTVTDCHRNSTTFARRSFKLLITYCGFSLKMSVNQ